MQRLPARQILSFILNGDKYAKVCLHNKTTILKKSCLQMWDYVLLKCALPSVSPLHLHLSSPTKLCCQIQIDFRSSMEKQIKKHI